MKDKEMWSKWKSMCAGDKTVYGVIAAIEKYHKQKIEEAREEIIEVAYRLVDLGGDISYGDFTDEINSLLPERKEK